MKRKSLCMVLAAVMMFGVNALPGFAVQNNNLHIAAVQYTGATDVSAAGYFYNVGSTTITGIKDLTLQIKDRDGKVVGDALFNDSKLYSICLEPGASIKWSFTLHNCVANGDLSKYSADAKYKFKSVSDASLAQGIKVYYNDQAVTFDGVNPVMDNGRVLIPIRTVAEVMGADVGWNPELQKISINKSGVALEMKIGDRNVTLNGKQGVLDVAPNIVGGKTMVPLRVVSETFGCSVFWGAEDQMVVITTK